MAIHSESNQNTYRLILYILSFWSGNCYKLMICVLNPLSVCLPQDMFCLYTPGGGGYGIEEDVNRRPQTKRRRLNKTFPERGSVFEYRMAQEGVWKEIRKRGRVNRQARIGEGNYSSRVRAGKDNQSGALCQRWKDYLKWLKKNSGNKHYSVRNKESTY